MAKTTTVTTSYTSNIVVNGTTVSADKIYANGTQVRRCIVNGKDVIHKFTRTVVTAYSNLTFTFQISYDVRYETACGYTDARFNSPIHVYVTVTDNGSSGFTSVTAGAASQLTFYCEGGTNGDAGAFYYYQTLKTAQSLTLGQTRFFTFSDFKDKYICDDDTEYLQDTYYVLTLIVTDPDGVENVVSIRSNDINIFDTSSYTQKHTAQRLINRVISDTKVQEY